MSTFSRFHPFLAMPLVLVILFSTFAAATAHANIVGTDELISESAVNAEREQVREFMTRDEVREQMEALGIDHDEAVSRIDSLSDSEVQQIAGRIDTLPAGEGVVGPIVGALVLIFIILLITDLLCLTNVFPFTKCATR